MVSVRLGFEHSMLRGDLLAKTCSRADKFAPAVDLGERVLGLGSKACHCCSLSICWGTKGADVNRGADEERGGEAHALESERQNAVASTE